MKSEDKLKCDCGKSKYEFQDFCYNCKEKQEVEGIWEYSKHQGEVTNEKYIICPYCGSHYGEDDMNESTEVVCENDDCEKRFKIIVEYYVSYSTYQKNKGVEDR